MKACPLDVYITLVSILYSFTSIHVHGHVYNIIMLVEQVDLHELITRLMIIKGIPLSASSDNNYHILPSQYSKLNKRATEIAYINMYLYNVALRTRALEYKFTCTCACTVVEAGTGRHMHAHLSLLYVNMYMQVNCTCT